VHLHVCLYLTLSNVLFNLCQIEQVIEMLFYKTLSNSTQIYDIRGAASRVLLFSEHKPTFLLQKWASKQYSEHLYIQACSISIMEDGMGNSELTLMEDVTEYSARDSITLEYDLHLEEDCLFFLSLGLSLLIQTSRKYKIIANKEYSWGLALQILKTTVIVWIPGLLF
ncbi:hypothetical protein ACJX0J_009558, partial [Zea mays]